MKRQLLTVLLLISLIVNLIPMINLIPGVSGDITETAGWDLFEIHSWGSGHSVFDSAVAPTNNQIFYCEATERFYVCFFYWDGSNFYPFEYMSQPAPDFDDSWDSLVFIETTILADTTQNVALMGGHAVAWIYNETTNEVHCTYASESYSGGDAETVFYKHGSIDIAGDHEIDWDSEIVVDTGVYTNHVDICETQGGYPAIVCNGYKSDDGDTYVYISAETDGSGLWHEDWFEPDDVDFENRVAIAPMPTGDQKCVVFSADFSTNNIRWEDFSYGSAVSGGAGNTLSTYDARSRTRDDYVSDWSMTYSDDTAYVGYLTTDEEFYLIDFSLETLTKGDEIELFNMTDIPAADYDIFNPILTLDENSVFITINSDNGTMTSFSAEYDLGEEELSEWVEVSLADHNYAANNDMIMTGSRWASDDGYALFCYLTQADWDLDGFCLTFEGAPLDEDYFTLTADLEDIDDDGADWVFTDWKYYNFSFETNMNPVNVSLQFTVPLGAENVAGGFFTDGANWTYASNMTYEMREGEPFRLQSDTWNFDDEENITTGSFLIWFENIILDVWEDPIDVYYSVNASEYEVAALNFFRIYSEGGYQMNFKTGGYTSGKVSSGGSPFDLYAANGSIVYNEIWYRDAQHIKLLPDIHFLTGLDEFYVRYGCDYSLGEGEWLEGWAIYINPKFVSYTGVFASNVWINMTNLWMNRGSLVDSEDLYMFYHGSVSGEGDPGHFKVWVDLWFSDKNASSVSAGRVNAYEYPMIDSADLWLRWLANNWGVKDDVLKEMSMSVPLLDDDNGTVIPSQRIKMVRYWCELEVADSDGGQWVYIEPHETFDVTHSRDLPLTGMSDPVFDETLIPTVNQRGILGALWTMFAGLGQWLSEDVIFGGLGLWDTFVNFLDTIAGMFGAPTFFSDLFSWLSDLFGYLALSAGYIITILGDIFELIAALMVTFLTTMGEIITALVNTFTMISDMLGGAYGAGINIWETLGISTWLTVAIVFYAVYLVILWDEKGLEPVIQQLTWLFGILTWIFQFLVSLIQFTIRLITTIIESIPVVE